MTRLPVICGFGAVFPHGCHHPRLGDRQQSAIADDEQALKRLVDRRGFRYKDGATRLAAAASVLALNDAGWHAASPPERGADELGVVAASCFGSAGTVIEACDTLRRETARGLSPMSLPNASPNVLASTLALWFGATGPNLFVSHGSTSGLDALAFGARLIRMGRAARILVCAAESAQPRLSEWLREHGEAPPFGHAVAIALAHAGATGDSGVAVDPWSSLGAEAGETSTPDLEPPVAGGFHSTLGLLLAIEQAVRLQTTSADSTTVSIVPQRGHLAQIRLRRV